VTVPFLIDGNNLMHAMAATGKDVGREGLCKLLAPLVAAGQRVHTVFDGPAPPAGVENQIAATGVEVEFSLGRPADKLILKAIAADSAPKRLTVVSTDREIRAAARKRRCKGVRSEDFAVELMHLNAASPRNSGPAEPHEKRHGLTPDQTRHWLREFGFEE